MAQQTPSIYMWCVLNPRLFWFNVYFTIIRSRGSFWNKWTVYWLSIEVVYSCFILLRFFDWMGKCFPMLSRSLQNSAVTTEHYAGIMLHSGNNCWWNGLLFPECIVYGSKLQPLCCCNLMDYKIKLSGCFPVTPLQWPWLVRDRTAVNTFSCCSSSHVCWRNVSRFCPLLSSKLVKMLVLYTHIYSLVCQNS